MPLASLAYSLAIALMIGWLLWLGQTLLLPILAAIISVYVLIAAAQAMRNVPLLGRAPSWLLRLFVLAGFTIGVALLFTLIVTTFARVVAAIPGYEANLDTVIGRGAAWLGFEDQPTWARLREATFDQIDTGRLVTPLVNSLRGLGGSLFLIVLYASFFLAERARFGTKLTRAIGDPDDRAKTLEVMARINERIGEYLLVKTFVNAVLGLVSFIIMWAIGIEFAIFWAVLIGFLNYIPYVGSLLGVAFPVLLCLAQFGSFAMAGLSLATLTAAQVYVGSVLEPRLMGRTFNLSPFVVLLALAFWGSLWGIPGAILSVPLTASLVIVLAEIRITRPFAVMMSANGKV
ncbi:AI-2E family transporter [Roseicyclus sp. F158]|uniref:AI-2E family transporter n=1 Tax=Tropicimonas omnivorans TaxID=3075590 RepID=A0ABU3DGI9_9RHOB|nr:AI-2E family transporter [Roseicyclus sp. F158]MDT0682679.1 AI-2E family transporter [Roseicyclus sp. F158]